MTIEEFNKLDKTAADVELEKCCGARKWVEEMVHARPFTDRSNVLRTGKDIWAKTNQSDWLEAFKHHPKIGDTASLEKKFANTKEWAGNEQKEVKSASKETIKWLAELNRVYEEKFGFIFIVCATGKSADEMISILENRLNNSYTSEIKIAAKEQQKITNLRLKKLLE